MQRLVALGASNLTRGLAALVRGARAAWGPGTQVLAALGHGRSYGLRSRFLIRDLPPILECELWTALAAAPACPTRGLVTDVGNDILYGAPPAQILAWVETCVGRLQEARAAIVVTGLPLASIDRLGPLRFGAFRRLFVPSCRLSLPEVARRAREVDDGLAQIARSRGAIFQPLPGDWYGFDPIHIRPRLWETAWRTILRAEGASLAPPRCDPLLWARLYAAAPARRWICGREQRRVQPVLARGDTTVGLY